MRALSLIDQDLLDASGILEWEEVQIWDVTNGNRLATYVISGPRGSGAWIGINGAAAHLVNRGDKVIIATFVDMEDAEARSHQPTNVFVDDDNRVKELRPEIVSLPA